ncbi:MAG: bis(5'-nucleosyl)-tetraphosphatase (symmetrical) YqeK [Oscillospiraceae bacterium]|nr:bis(5'-nucleosyl)-tetraphosphatase (symmetrical) YqeK [Oscillospiraceae bacterium]
MVSIDEITDLIKERLSKKRYHHSLNVADSAKELAKRWGEDTKRAYLGGLVHDICKELPKPQQLEMARHSSAALTAEEELVPALWHAPAGEVYCRTELGIQDEDLLMAVRFHTVGRAGMSLIEEVIFLADLIGADRDYKDVNKMRKLAFEDKDRAMFEALSFSITDVAKKGSVIPLHTAQAYNQYAKKLMKQE